MARTSFPQKSPKYHHKSRLPNPTRTTTTLASTTISSAPSTSRPQLRPSASHNPDHLAASVDSLLDSCLAKSTLDGYASAVNRFLDFCDTENIDKSRRFPTDEPTLSAYAASFAGVTSGKTAASAMAALKTWHALHNHPWQGSTRLTYVLKAVSNQAPASSHKPPRAGVDRNALKALHDGLTLTDPFDAAVYAAAAIAFWGQCRLGGLLGTSRVKHRPIANPSRSSIPPNLAPNSSTDLHLPRTKTSQNAGERIRITTQNGRTDPIYALRNHLYVNSNLPQSSHLFSFRNATGATRYLTKEPFLKRCNTIWHDHGLDRLTGHSFRIGGTNHFLSEGVSPDVVKVMGRWRSDAFLVYWRNTHTIASHHAEHAGRSSKA